jgi:hypothetical protein
VLQRNVNAIREARGIPHINHPNYRWSHHKGRAARRFRTTSLLRSTTAIRR